MRGEDGFSEGTTRPVCCRAGDVDCRRLGLTDACVFERVSPFADVEEPGYRVLLVRMGIGMEEATRLESDGDSVADFVRPAGSILTGEWSSLLGR